MRCTRRSAIMGGLRALPESILVPIKRGGGNFVDCWEETCRFRTGSGATQTVNRANPTVVCAMSTLKSANQKTIWAVHLPIVALQASLRRRRGKQKGGVSNRQF